MFFFFTVTLIPALCGSTTAAGPGQLVRSHGQLNNDSVYENYTEPVTSCRYVMTAATSDEQLSFGFGTGDHFVYLFFAPLKLANFRKVFIY